MVTSMLEMAIEIEGLLRIIRDGSPLPETYYLLAEKTKVLASEVTVLVSESTSQPAEEEASVEEKPDADFIMAAPEATPEPPKVDFTATEALKENTITVKSKTAEEPQHVSIDNSEIDLDLEDEDDIILSFDDITDTIPAHEDFISIDHSEPTGDEVTVKENVPEESTSIEEHEATEGTRAANPMPPTESDEEKSTPAKKVKLRSVFSLNDRFLYARELFNGNMKMFDSTLDFLDGIDDFSIIEDYFYNELEWNREDDNVAAFMERLRGMF